MRRASPSGAVWALLLMGLVLLAPSCTHPGAPSPPAAAPSRPTGHLVGSVFHLPEQGLSWPNPGGFAPVWPGPGHDATFGWAKGEQSVTLWAPESQDSLAWQAHDLAQAQGWEMELGRAVSWKGLAAWEAGIAQGRRAGKLRILAGPGGSLAVAALVPAEHVSSAAGLLEGLRLAPPGDLSHLVRYPDESLSLLSWWYTGVAANWMVIQAYNRLDEPRLALGQEVLIPAALVVRTCPLPPELVPRAATAGKPAEDGEAPPGEAPLLKPVGPK